MNKKIEAENIIGSGAKRLRHGTYRTAYKCSRGHGKYAFRGEIQSVDTRGVIRLRKWFKTLEEAWRWAHGMTT